MAPQGPDPSEDPHERSEASKARGGTSGSASRESHPLRPAADRLVGLLREDCNDVVVTARGFNYPGFERAIRTFARDAKRLSVPVERMLVLLKQCLYDERLPRDDIDTYARYMNDAVIVSVRM